MAGIYIHIPFCKTRCHYCNFYSMASVKHKPAFVDKLLEEIQLQRSYLGDQAVNTIYLGGGTPSLLNADELNRIFDGIQQNFNVSEDAEISLEANPDDVSPKWVTDIRETMVNRISMGVQSFHDDDLQYLNRIHSAEEAVRAIKLIQDSGIDNLTIDLIYGIPGLSIQKWEENLERFFTLNIPHLSAYALTVEKKTALDNLIAKGKVPAPEEKESIAHFKTLIRLTEENEFIHYEISNFALEGFYSKHNSTYWTGGHYLGLGPSAHSYNGHTRRWNKASTKKWLELKEYYSETFEEEVLSPEQRYNEYVMTSLRTIWGCDISLVQQEFGDNYAKHLLAEANKHVDIYNLEHKGNRLFLTAKGKLFADGIASDLFI
jgi:oxygen-independent coproporphyrinogen-3 oxidase